MYAPTIHTQKHVKAKLCMVGEVGVGKTSLVRRFVTDKFDDRYIATVGTKVTKKSLEITWRGNDSVLDMTIWDIMGDKGFRRLLKEAYFHGAQGILAICDLTRPDTLFDLNAWVNTVIKQAGDIPFVFMGNKVDLNNEICVTEEEIARLAAIHQSPYFLTSAKSGENVEKAFRTLSNAIVDSHSRVPR